MRLRVTSRGISPTQGLVVTSAHSSVLRKNHVVCVCKRLHPPQSPTTHISLTSLAFLQVTFMLKYRKGIFVRSNNDGWHFSFTTIVVGYEWMQTCFHKASYKRTYSIRQFTIIETKAVVDLPSLAGNRSTISK